MFVRGCLFLGLLLTVELASANIATIYGFDPTPIVGFNMELSCNTTMAAAVTPVTIVWLQDGSTILPGSSTFTVGTVTTGYISIPITSRDMAGTSITCQISNGVLQREDTESITDVRSRPVVGAILPVNGAGYFDEGAIGTWNINVNGAYPSITEQKCYVSNSEISIPQPTQTVNTAEQTYNFVITIQRSLSAADHGLTIRCTIKHETFPEPDNLETRTTVMLVRHDPGQPTISTSFGTSGVNENSNIHGNCTSVGGYPTPTVVWTGPANMVFSVPAQQANVVSTRFDITATVGLIGATFTCTASNVMGTYSASTTLSQVYVQPQAVLMTGPNVAYQGIAVNYTCETPESLPASNLHWHGFSTDVVQQYFPSTISANIDGTFKTVTGMTILPNAANNILNITCEARHSSTTTYSLQNSIIVTVHMRPAVTLTTASTENVRITSDYSIDYTVLSTITYNVTWWHESPVGSGIISQVIHDGIKYFIFLRSATVTTLTIRNYQTTDDGGYYTTAANHAGLSAIPIGSNVAQTTGYAIPSTPEIITFNSFPMENSLVLMNCTSSGGVPSAEIIWHRNNREVDRSYTTGNSVTYNSYTHQATFSDKGATFKCEASNLFGNASAARTFVDVYVAPSSTPTITGANALWESHTYYFICTTSANNPAATISWTFGGENVTSEAISTQQQNSQKPGTFDTNSNLTLIIEKEDVGKVLTCYVNHVTQPGAPLSSNHPLTVYLIPTAYIAEQNPVAEIGTNHAITCNVDTVLTATVTWYKSETTGNTQLQNGLLNYVIGERSLIFSSVLLQHEGNYMCMASNAAGSSPISSSVYFTVYQLPGVPNVVFPSTAVEGQPTVINATSFGGYPAPALTWERNGTVVDDTYTAVGTVTYNSYVFNPTLADIQVPFKVNAFNAYGVYSASRTFTDVFAPATAPAIQGNIVAFEGTPITYQCFSARARPAPALYWRFGATDMTSQATQSTVNNYDLVTVHTTSNLTITPVAEDVNKNLTCYLHQPNGRSSNLSVILSLQIYLKPRVTLETGNTNVRIGTDKTLRCISISALDVTVTWFVDNTQISPSTAYIMVRENLTIIDFEPEDNGAYSCISQNEAGYSNQSRQVVLTAYAPPGLPMITRAPTSIPTENSVVSLTCRTSNGVPAPNVTWTKNGAPVFNSITTTVTDTFVNSTLTFVANYVTDTAAVFLCTTMNEFGTQSASHTIPQVYVLPTQGGTILQGNATLYEGFVSQFYCEHPRTHPTASITWILGQEILVGQTQYGQNADGTGRVYSNLSHEARYSDTGNLNLVCRVTHTTGVSINKTLQLYGFAKPRVSIPNPSVLVAKGSSQVLHCAVVSELGVMVNWFRAGTGARLTSNDLYIFNGPNVTIKAARVSDEGGYYCMARNTAGNSTYSNTVMVTVFANPTKPVITGLHEAVLENMVITINCTATDGYPLPVITWYRDGIRVLTAPAGLHSSYTFQVGFSDREAFYTCTATNTYNSATSDPTKIPDVYLLPSGVSLTGPAEVYETKMSVFLCTVNRVSPNPSFSWRVGADVVSSTFNITTTPANTLGISSYFSHIFVASDMGKNISCDVTQLETNTVVTRSKAVILHLLPTVLNAAQNLNVELYTNPTVTCVVSSTESDYNVIWYKDGAELDIGGSLGKFSTTKTALTITSFQVTDSGLYTCRVSHQGGSSGMSQPTNLTGFEYPLKPFITSSHVSRIVTEGDTLMLNCSTTGGVPVPSLVWKRGTSDVVVDASSTSSQDQSNNLVYNEYASVVSFSDNSSVYICEANNPHLKVTSIFALLDVYVTPVPTVIQSAVIWDQANAIASYYEGQTYTINGTVPRFNPKTAAFGWSIDNQNLPPNYVVESITNEGVHAYTSAIDVLMTENLDGKQVTFSVQHLETTSSSVSFTISILYKPRVSFSQTSGQVQQGQNYVITCDVTSSLPFNITWTIQGSNTPLVNGNKYQISGANGRTLTINNANFSDSLTYVCSSMNSAGAGTTAEFYLIVYREVGQPQMNDFDKSVVDGTTVSVSCNSSGGVPPATISWQKNGVPLVVPTPTYGNDASNPVYSVITFVVNFNDDRNAIFKCTASNAYSSISEEKSFQDVYIFSNTMTMSGTQPTTVTAGTPYTFYSETSEIYPAPRVFWFINNVRQFNGIIYNLTYTSSNTYWIYSSFLFTPSRTDNGHQVTCVFDHSLESGLSINASRTLNVQFETDPPSIDGFSSSVLEFTQQSLLCTVSGGNPRPEVRWYKNNTLIPGTSNTEITDGQGNLVTQNRYNFTVTQADSFAVYTCLSQHVVRNWSQSVTLEHVLASPSNIILTLPSEPLTASQPIIGGSPNLLVGRSYEFRAEVGRAWPAPVIDWRVGNNFPTNHSSVSSDNTDGTVRTISSLYYAPSLADNGHDLTLLVYHPRTSATPVTQTALLVVHGTPLVAITPDSIDIIINQSFIARCNVTSSLNSYSVNWYKENEAISSDARTSLSGDFLTISSVQFDDNGAYRCSATNAAGTAIQSNAITLSVISEGGQPAISGFVSTPNENDILAMSCTSAGGVPTPTVSWLKDGVNVNAGDSMRTENGVIYKTSTWNYNVAYADRNANFTCLVSNSVANLTRSRQFTAVFIPPASVPNAVTGPTTTTAGFQTTFSINFPRVSPAPLVTWAIGGVALPSNVPPVVSVPTTEGALNATASVTFTQRAEYNTKALVATVTQPQSGVVFDVSATLTVKSQPSQPVVEGFPAGSTSIVGNSHTLVCTSRGGFPAPTLRWYRNNIPVQINYNTVFTSDPIVTAVTYNMAVTLAEKNVVYRCTAENEIRTLSTNVTLADVYVKTSVSISGSSDVIAGKNSSMSCTTSASHPQPSVEWELVDQSDVVTPLPMKADVVGQPDGNGLVSVTSTVYFFPALADNRKTVRCVAAQSVIGHSEADSSSITVHGPPSVAAASDKNVTLGVSVDLSCAVTSSLTSYNVSWYKQDQTGQTPVPIQTNLKYALGNANPYKLWIHNIDVNDTGRYYCIAQSAAGTSAPSEASVTVYTAPSTPTFANDVTTVTVRENQGGITATCLATVYPANTASYKWQFSPADGSSPRTEVPDTLFNGNQLNIPSASRAQAGTYFCQAYNSYGSTEAFFTADVQYPPELATNAKTSYSDATVDELVVLSCEVVANPPSGITYVWTYQNQRVGSSANLEVNVKSGENAYTCVATNAVGNSEGLIFTIVAPPQDNGASTGASTAEEGGLSGGIIAAIVLGVIFIILILIICCVGCKYYKDKKADEKTKRTTKKSKSKHKPSSVVPDTDDRRSTLYPKTKDPALLFGPARTHEQRHYPRDLSYIERDYSQRAPYDHTYYIPAPGSEMDDMSVYRETGFRSHRRKMPFVLPPLERGDYTGEAKRRKDRRKKNKKKRAQERQSGEGMENPGKSKDNSPPINLDDNQPEKDGNTDTNVLLGDQFKN
ncbi:hemicentin-1-like isoform X2 [Argopecten irradians]|uniref:hemicentin-1-like isoform X2 n=1 Tax=Argopecten irradians TaxID=31199 RepID=UPI0037147CC5